MNKRREFLVQCGAAAVTAGLGPLAVSAGTMAPWAGPGRAADRFRPLLGEHFVLRDAATGAESSVRLTAVHDEPVQAAVEQFSLRFDGAAGPRLPEGTYRARARSHVMQSFDLFVSPSGEEGGAAAYRAYFCLLS